MPKHKKEKKLSRFEMVLEIVILLIFVKLMFSIHYLVGMVYIFAIGMAIWKGLIMNKKHIAWMIILGTFLAYFAGLFIPHIFGTYLAGDIVSAVIIFIVALLIWRTSIKLRMGKKII